MRQREKAILNRWVSRVVLKREIELIFLSTGASEFQSSSIKPIVVRQAGGTVKWMEDKPPGTRESGSMKQVRRVLGGKVVPVALLQNGSNMVSRRGFW